MPGLARTHLAAAVVDHAHRHGVEKEVEASPALALKTDTQRLVGLVGGDHRHAQIVLEQ